MKTSIPIYRAKKIDSDGLTCLYLNNNKIEKIEGLVAGLKSLDLDNNKIEKIEGLVAGLKWLDLRNNKIKKIEGLVDGVKSLVLSNNPITEIDKKSYDLIKNNHIAIYGVDIEKLKIV